MLTWKELKAHIETMDEEQLYSQVTIHLSVEDEFIPADTINYVSENGNGVLDPLHPYLVVEH